MLYTDYQNENVSEKIVLAKIKASKRLVAFTLHSGSVYKITSFDFAVIESIKESGTALTEVNDLASVTAGKFYNDRVNKILYLRVADSTHPNGKFLSMKFWLFYSNVGISLANDLASGFDVYWEPLLKSTSDFGVEIDNEEQLGYAIEGSGQVVFLNDRNYWDDKIELYVWDNQPVYIYSTTRGLLPSEAKPIYSGRIVGKSISNQITFKLKDQLAQLRQPLPLSNISELTGELVPDALLQAKQRRIYGKVSGYVPTNIEQLVDGWLLSGTISVSAGSSTITGTGTSFLNDISQNDQILLTVDGEIERFTVKFVNSDTNIEVTEAVDFFLSAQPLIIEPALPKNYINRVWLLAGHECNHVSRTVQSSDSSVQFELDSVEDIFEGDDIYINGEVKPVERILGNKIRLSQSLLTAPGVGDTLVRPCVQNVRLNNKKLVYERDYTVYDSSGKMYLELKLEAEKNINPVRAINGSVTITSGSINVTGSGTQFTAQLQPEQWIRGEGNFDYFQILQILSDTSLTLKTQASYSDSGGAQYISGHAFDSEIDHLTCDLYGTTDDGLTSGALLRSASQITEHILESVNITNLNATSFSDSNVHAPYLLGLAIPKHYSDTLVQTVRDIINEINLSVFGSLVQNENLELEYNILRPNKPPNAIVLREYDILNFSISSSNERVCKSASVAYNRKEFDYESGLTDRYSFYSKSSDVGTYLVESQQTKDVNTLLYYEDDARILANRWAFLLELGTNVITINTKMQAARLQVNDVVKIEHEKLFERVGGGRVKYAAVQGIKKNGSSVTIELDDLSNMFNRVAMIAESGSPDFNNSSTDQKALNGFVTDSYGLINNDENTSGLNLIW